MTRSKIKRKRPLLKIKRVTSPCKIPRWELPDPFKQYIAGLNEIGLWLLRRGFYSDAQTIHEIRYNLIIDRQHLSGKRLHKGSPLFEIAICSIAKQEHIAAILFLLAANVEDILSESDLHSVEILLPAYSILTDKSHGYGLDYDLLNKLNDFVVEERDKKDPKLMVEKFLKGRKISHEQLESLIHHRASFNFNKYELHDPPGSKEKRVFVGGNNGNYVVIGLIENILIELDYQPIIANQFIQAENVSDKEHCFALIRISAVALFEISVPNGWQVEVEHTSAHNIPLLCLYQGEKPSRFVSSMLKGYPNSGWKMYDDLKEAIKSFLEKTLHE
ncbi:MAG: hypothetical protein ABSD41_11765 [Candidatus Bathyarchaeia archaeon]